ncbi:related to nuclear protein SDK3 [Rhynchosporium agropyri]|uniref:Related to nuclear protein SDK3 n=1 Tax=Rhynchosporium agropyri TaxID=914238 RepID=A0A1E1KYU5_9HELO|nr:related to nuclear protein SDK3 [Rhynchosporium agropyri]
MADTNGPISSVVVLPEAEAITAPLKRQKSSASDSTTKRPRLSLEASSHFPTTLRDSPQPIEPSKSEPEVKVEDGAQNRRKSSVQEEKKRGQRLFGGLLSTLSQSTPNGQQKRRLEIEKRQHEKVKQQKEADEARRRERLADLKAIRRAEQIIYDEAEMQTRHSNLLAMANFLSTKAQPKIYYKPWKLLPEDEERIKSQLREAEAMVERETTQFDLRHPNRPGRAEKEERPEGTGKETVGEPQDDSLLGEPQNESPSVSKVDNTTNSHAQIPQPEQHQAEKQAQEEHNGEVLVENAEDTVIY